MNIIQISERLKDAPDSFLLREVQSPTGAVPSYLVISELTRRKRMRDAAPQQKPQTTVAEDVASEASSGLTAMPQAQESLAARDVMGAGAPEEEPVEMAGGGLVAFQNRGLVEGQFYPGAMTPIPGGRDAVAASPFSAAALEQMAAPVFAYQPTTPEQRAEAREAGMKRFAEELPFRGEVMQKDIEEKTADIARQKESNINLALMQAGLGMMGSRSPYGLQGIAEGGLRGLQAYREGGKDITEAQRYLDRAKEKFDTAKTLYDEKRIAAGDKYAAEAQADRERGLSLIATQLQTAATLRGAREEDFMRPIRRETATLGLESLRATQPSEIEAARLKPEVLRAQIGLARAQAAAAKEKGSQVKVAKPENITQARTLAAEILRQNGVLPSENSREYELMVDNVAQRVLLDAGLVYFGAGRYVPPTSTPGLPGGTAPKREIDFSQFTSP